MNNQERIKEIKKGMSDSYDRYNRVIEYGRGDRLYDVEGNEIINWISCYSADLGQCNHRIINAAVKQLNKLSSATSNLTYHIGQIFPGELAKFCGYDKALLMNTGAEGNDTAIKIIRALAHRKMGIPVGKSIIGGFHNAFHGRTLGALSLMDNPHYVKNFDPPVGGTIRGIPFNDIPALEKTFKENENLCAIIMEPILIEGGVIIPDDNYLTECRKLCHENNALFVLDCVQTGFGRTGKWFAWQREGEKAKPDLMIVGKLLGAGVIPISAVVGNLGKIDIFESGEHGSTYSGNPLACAIGSKVLKILREEKLDAKARAIGGYLLTRLREELAISDNIKEIRGVGALIAIEIEPKIRNPKKFCNELLEQGVLTAIAGKNVIRITPPILETTKKTIDEAMLIFKKVLC
jgi:ornithine--oxo-acid transaminase